MIAGRQQRADIRAWVRKIEGGFHMLRSTALLGCGLLAAACAGGGDSVGSEPNPPGRQHAFVRISNASLSPETTTLAAGGRLSFVNTSSYTAVVILQAAASDFECTRLGPVFQVEGDRIRSQPINDNGNRSTLPCPMKPGSYDYGVQLSGGFYGIGNLQLEHQGQIRVEARQKR